MKQRFVHVLFNEEVSAEVAQELLDQVVEWAEAHGLSVYGETGVEPEIVEDEDGTWEVIDETPRE